MIGHAHAIAEDRATRERTRRVDREHRDLLSERTILRDHHVDER